MLHVSHQQMQELLTSRTVVAAQELGFDLYHTTFQSIIDDPICKGSTQSVQIREGITFMHLELTFHQDTEVEMFSTQPQVGFGFCLKGHSTAYVKEVGGQRSELAIHYADRTTFIYANPSSSGYQHFWKDKALQAFYIHFRHDTFKELIGEALQELPIELFTTLHTGKGSYLYLAPMSHELHVLCLNLRHTSFKGKSREFYIEAKVMELIAYHVDTLLHPGVNLSAVYPPLSKWEEKQIDQCYRQLQKNVSHPPSLLELAKGSGLSVYRLKNGFRARYGDTPFQILTELRMLHAKALLEKGELNVSEIALEAGYSSLGTFSNTFFERFGLRPSAYKK
jgi:AraC-like DNA-binding protein